MCRLLLLLLILTAVAVADQPLVLGTGSPGGVYMPYGKGLAPFLGATTRQTAGAVENLKLVRSGEAQLAMATVDSAYDAVRGTGAYVDGGPVNIKTLAVLYPSMLHVVTLQSSDIHTLEDLKGRRVSMGSPGTSSQIATGRLLRIAEIPVIPSFLGVTDAAQALKHHEIDAFFWICGLPSSGVIGIGEPIRLLDVTAYQPRLVETYGPVYTVAALPGGTYPGCPQDTPSISINNILVCKGDLPDQTVTGLLEAMFGRLEQVRKIHPEAARLSKAYCGEGSSIEFHPAALRFYAK